MKSEKCKHSDVEHVRKFVSHAKRVVNDTRYYPPSRGHRYIVALALYSKCLTVAEATMILVDAGYADEAFGMTRTLVDIFITLRYIAIKDTDDRAKRYANFLAKDIEVWSDVVRDFFPSSSRPMSPHMKELAGTYTSPHKWSGKPFKDMALEEDPADIDPLTGKPVSHEFTYRAIYRWTSHYVHPTIPALANHVVQAGHDNFVVNGGNAENLEHLATFNVACYVNFVMVYFYRCMKDQVPKRLDVWGEALLKHLARVHRA